MTTTETPAAVITSEQVEQRMAFLESEVAALMAHFQDRSVTPNDAVTVMAMVQARVCASLGEGRDTSFAGMQEMLAGLFDGAKQDFDQHHAKAGEVPR